MLRGMDVMEAFASLASALGLGLLVGVQRERSASELGGVRTFPLITVLGTVSAILSESLGGWVFAAGLGGVAAATAIGNLMRPVEKRDPGITTEVAMLLMFCCGGLLWAAPRQIGVAVGVACAVLLHFKAGLHGFAARVSEKDLRAILQFALITFIVLPVLPDRTFGPLNVLNPREIWWMVVLVVGISLVAYVAYKVLPRTSGAIVGGLLGGMISSTASTAGFARRARSSPAAAPSLALAICIASTVVFVRVTIEIATVGSGVFWRLAPPIWMLLLAGAAGAGALWAMHRNKHEPEAEPENPTELKSAFTFALLYALVLLAVEFTRQRWGSGGLYIAAAISGLTDMDAITLSTTRMVNGGHISASTGWRAVMIASMANLVFKVGLAGAIGGRGLLKRLIAPIGAVLVTGCVVILLWPD